MTRELRYADVGVNIEIEAQAARLLYEAARQTWPNRQNKLGQVVTDFDDFAGSRFIRVESLPKGTVMFSGSDGIASKAEFAERIHKYDTLGFDLLAMVCDDAVVRGGEPVYVTSVLDVNTLGNTVERLRYIKQLAKGYVAAANAAEVAIVNGEIAQLTSRKSVSKQFSLDWSADVTWFAHESRLLPNKLLSPDDYLVGLREDGLRCNGISLIRRILKQTFGTDYHQHTFEGKSVAEWALRPSQIYSKAIVAMTGGYDLRQPAQAAVHAVAHITGGGIPEKLGRILKPSGFGVLIDDPYEPGAFMQYCQQLGKVSDTEAYRTWHMGQGMILATPEPEKVIKVAREHQIEAKIIGKVTATKGIKIRSQGVQTRGKILEF